MKRIVMLIGLVSLVCSAIQAQLKNIDVMETIKINREVSTPFVTGDHIK